MQVRLFEKGSEPPPSSDGVVEDIATEHLPNVGDVIQLEGKNAEVVRRYRVVSRLFRSPLTGSSTELALEVEQI
jgi:hypothetical protein